MSNIFDRGQRFIKLILPLMIITAVCATIVSAGIALAGEESLENRLSAYGLAEVSVSLSGNEVTVAYTQPVSEASSLSEQLAKIATILSFVSEEVPEAVLARVEQHFDDGQIMEISGKPSDGVAFLNRQISEDDFMGNLEFTPLTRGPLIMPGECEPDLGENCENCPECGCYPNERCDPADPQANERGCVELSTPENAHLEGSEYVCNEGYEWNSDLISCVPKLECPPNAFKFQGECYCNSGYEWDTEGKECVPVQDVQPGEPSSVSGESLFDTFKGFIDSFINWVKALFT